ncbi:hypothetical protein LINPERPRIM_LOCUS7606 [Linum perenne]
MIVQDELLTVSIEMAKRNLRGVFTNLGFLTHNELLELYQKYRLIQTLSGPISLVEEQTKMVGARSSNELDSSKLKSAFPGIIPVKESQIKYVFEPNKKAY